MNATIIAEKIESSVELGDGGTAECQVFDIGNCEVFKLFHSGYTFDRVKLTVQLNRKYAKQKLAPQVLSDVIEVYGRYGYITEQIEPLSSYDVEDSYFEQLDDLAEALGVTDIDEMYHNCGLTNSGDFVLFDWGTFSLMILGLISSNEL